MSGTAEFIVVAEDYSGARFVEAFLRSRGVTNHQIRTLRPPNGVGSGKRWVTTHYEGEVRAYRAKTNSTRKALIVCTDADELTVPARAGQLAAELTAAEQAPRRNDERIVHMIPKWEIETWAEHVLRCTHVSEESKMGWSTERSRAECANAGRVLRDHRNPPMLRPPCCPPSLQMSDGELLRL